MTTDDSDLDWTDEGAPRSRRFGDVYFSRSDGLAESRAVYLAGCGLPEAWRGRTSFTVAELGFGAGLNILALLDLWRRERPTGGRLHIFSVEAWPISAAEAARAHALWPELADLSALLTDRWPPPTPGFHRIDLPELHAVLDVAVMDAAAALQAWSGPADAWFLDGFAPATNPAMWSDAVLDAVAARSAPGARAATFTVAGAVRRGLAERGFAVDKRPGYGRKRERLEAVAPGPRVQPGRPQRIAVIGGGVAGAAVVRALAGLGCVATLIEAEAPGAGASGLPAGLVTPRLDVGDGTIAALHAQALSRAAALYRPIPGAVTAQGVIRLEHSPRDAGRFDRIAAQPIWPGGRMARLSAGEVSARLGEKIDRGALWMAEALAVSPLVIVKAWLADAPRIRARVGAIERSGAAAWRLLDAAGAPVMEADAVVIAAGAGAAALWPDLSLQPVRGQAEWRSLDGPAPPAVAWGGYVAPGADGVLFGATHDRDDAGDDVRPADRTRNLTTLGEVLPGLALRLAGRVGTSWAAVRMVTPDRHPVCGPVAGAPGLWVLGGLGSRGFALAPLLGEHLAAAMTGVASPLPASAAALVAPSRKGLGRNQKPS